MIADIVDESRIVVSDIGNDGEKAGHPPSCAMRQEGEPDIEGMPEKAPMIVRTSEKDRENGLHASQETRLAHKIGVLLQWGASIHSHVVLLQFPPCRSPLCRHEAIHRKLSKEIKQSFFWARQLSVSHFAAFLFPSRGLLYVYTPATPRGRPTAADFDHTLQRRHRGTSPTPIRPRPHARFRVHSLPCSLFHKATAWSFN